MWEREAHSGQCHSWARGSGCYICSELSGLMLQGIQTFFSLLLFFFFFFCFNTQSSCIVLCSPGWCHRHAFMCLPSSSLESTFLLLAKQLVPLCISYFFYCCDNTWTKQVKKERIYLGSEFENTVHHSWGVMVADLHCLLLLLLVCDLSSRFCCSWPTVCCSCFTAQVCALSL